MIQSPINNVIVTIKSLYSRYVSDITKTAFSEVNGVDINPADFVTIVGEVVSVPRTISKRKDYEGFTTDNIKPGDIAIFAYSVVFDFDISEEQQKFKNCFWFKGKEYWMADIQKVFGVIRDGNIMMINGYCMIEKMQPVTNLLLPQHLKRISNVAEATATKLSVKNGYIEDRKILPMDTIFYNPLRVQKYTVNNMEIGILQHKNIMGNKIAGYADFQQFE